MTLSIPIFHEENKYVLVSYGKGTTEFECTHLHFHRETLKGEMFEREGLAEYTGYADVCDNPDCEEVVENTMEDGCNE